MSMLRDRRYKLIDGYLNGQKVYILGGGTSLRGFDLSKLHDKTVIAVNHSIEAYPAAQMLIFGDKVFPSITRFDLKSYEGMIFASDNCKRSKPIDEMHDRDNVYFFEPRRDEPIRNPKMGLFHPTSSGLLGLNLAIQMRAKKIFLLGYDYYKDESGSMHFYDDYPHHRKYSEERMAKKLKKFKYFEQWKTRITNCSPNSYIEDFRKLPLEAVFGKDCYTGA